MMSLLKLSPERMSYSGHLTSSPSFSWLLWRRMGESSFQHPLDQLPDILHWRWCQAGRQGSFSLLQQQRLPAKPTLETTSRPLYIWWKITTTGKLSLSENTGKNKGSLWTLPQTNFTISFYTIIPNLDIVISKNKKNTLIIKHAWWCHHTCNLSSWED